MPVCGLGFVVSWVSVAWTLVSLRPASLKYYLHFLFISSLELGLKGENGEGKKHCERLSIPGADMPEAPRELVEHRKAMWRDLGFGGVAHRCSVGILARQVVIVLLVR